MNEPEKYVRPLCPACGNPLKHVVNIAPGGGSVHVVYCSVGRCPNSAANKGAEGVTLAEAMKTLTMAIQEAE
jgi:hypothetical protein